MNEYTDAQIETAIIKALAAQNVEAVASLLTLLALQNPHRAEVLRDLMLVGAQVALDRGVAPE